MAKDRYRTYKNRNITYYKPDVKEDLDEADRWLLEHEKPRQKTKTYKIKVLPPIKKSTNRPKMTNKNATTRKLSVSTVVDWWAYLYDNQMSG